MEKVVIDKESRFAVIFSRIDDGPVTFRGVEITSYEEDANGHDRYNYLYKNSNEDVEDPANAQSFFTGFIKWDGCMEIHDLNYHWCGYDNIMERVVQMIYVETKKIMGDGLDSGLAQLKDIPGYGKR